MVRGSRQRWSAFVGSVVSVLLLGSVLAAPTPALAGDRIGPRYFGVDISISPSTVWPSFSPGVVRVATGWSSIERSPGTYSWTDLDAKVATAEDNDARPMLVLEGTPRFHALGPDQPSYGSPPSLDAYRALVRALVARYGTRVDYEVWNEANVLMFFSGTPEHMAMMTKIMGETVGELAPDATVVAPSFPLRYNRIWAKRYWNQRPDGRPVGDFVDVAALSVYPMIDEGPEESLELIRWMQSVVLDGVGFEGPLWATEVNYGANGLEPTARIRPGLQAAYVVRTYVLHSTMGADRVFWWRWEPHQTVNTQLQDGAGNMTRAGEAYGVVRDWLLGTKPKGCTVTRGGLYSCTFNARDGVRRHVFWQRAGKVRKVVAPARARVRVNAKGVARTIKPGRRFRVGASPIMVEVRLKR